MRVLCPKARKRMRRDAERNHSSLLLAGRQALQEAGGTASVELICAAAGVTRATFYRHFADRTGLHMAVLDMELEEMRRMLASPLVHPLAFLRLLADMIRVYDRYLLALPDLPDFEHADASAGKILEVIAPSLARAQQQGLIREDLTGADVLIVCRMAGSDWRLDRQNSKEDALQHRLALLLRGLVPSGACDQTSWIEDRVGRPVAAP
jgi:AcrR family transcriptional regulator